MPRPQANPPRRSAFTLIEVVVVIVVLAVLAAALVPRMVSIRGKEAQAAAERFADLLSIAARRDSLTSQRLAVEFDAAEGRLRLVTLSTPADAAAAPSALRWQPDPLAAPAEAGSARIVEAAADGAPLDPRHWRVELPQNTMRPAISLVISDQHQTAFYRVDLPSRGTRAIVSPGRAPSAQVSEGVGFIDLDASGQGETAW